MPKDLDGKWEQGHPPAAMALTVFQRKFSTPLLQAALHPEAGMIAEFGIAPDQGKELPQAKSRGDSRGDKAVEWDFRSSQELLHLLSTVGVKLGKVEGLPDPGAGVALEQVFIDRCFQTCRKTGANMAHCVRIALDTVQESLNPGSA
ncbi:MAG: hypothetical protein A2Y91_03265 [Chloroflexi bacterium RBG_13_54_8]|nr:MAG: hypothetical protein A2Y91_03265 [Chloroflexi bacterium RBG_13_54_8]